MPSQIVLAAAALVASATSIAQKTAIPTGVPSYVTQYAPIVYLYSGEKYFPSDIGLQLSKTTPMINFTTINGAASSYTLDTLNQLNNFGNNGTEVWLSSTIPEYDFPSWFSGVVPDSTGATENAISTFVIVNDHHNGNVDAFYFYFYAFNFGGTYYDEFTIDDHVGDLEYNAIRFTDGVPTQMWFSEHSYGSAYTFAAVEKYNNGSRPISYSGNGTHSNYPTAGTHEIKLPLDNIEIPGIDDYTDAGYLWDPTLSAYWYSYDNLTQIFTAYDNSTPVNWLYFNGAFGDKQLPTFSAHQSCILDISAVCKWEDGPTGPIGHQLSRATICPDAGNCPIATST